MAWTDERIEQLRKLWEAGNTASQIAEELGGVSRNAVIGKAHRLGLQSRPSPVRSSQNSEAAAAAAAPTDVDAQFAVADLDLAGGHVEDAFGRLLELFAQLPSDDRAPVRERLLELFALVGDADPRVIRARGQLSSLLF